MCVGQVGERDLKATPGGHDITPWCARRVSDEPEDRSEGAPTSDHRESVPILLARTSRRSRLDEGTDRSRTVEAEIEKSRKTLTPSVAPKAPPYQMVRSRRLNVPARQNLPRRAG